MKVFSSQGASAVEGLFGMVLMLAMIFTILQFTLICLGQSLAVNNAYVNARQKLVNGFFQENNYSVTVPVIMPLVDGVIGEFVQLNAQVELGQNPKMEGDNKPQNGNKFSFFNQN